MKTKTIFYTICFLTQVASTEAQDAEKIVLITDKQWYYPGESLWFSLNVFDACAGTLSDFSKIAYIESIGADNRPVQQLKVAISDAHGDGSLIVGENIATGTYRLVAYTNWMKNFDPKNYSSAVIQVVNPAKQASLNFAPGESENDQLNAGKLKVEIPKSVYTKREHIPVTIGNTTSSHLTVSVFRTDALQRGAGTIANEQIAGPCKIDEPARFLAEDRGDIVSGRVIDKRTQQPAAGIRGYLSVVNSPNDLHVATSDSTGTIRFELGSLRGKKELVLQTNADIDSNYSIELMNEYADNLKIYSDTAKQNVSQTASAAVNEALVSAQVQQYFYSQNIRMVDTAVNSDVPFYGRLDELYLMSDYVHFTTVEEIFREYITLVGIQIHRRRLIPVVYDVQEDRKPFTGPPLILVNGVPVFDPDRLMAMNSDDFYSVGVVGKKYFLGHQMFYGVIDIRLNKALDDFGRNTTVVDYDAASIDKHFSSPAYTSESKKMNRKPDFRNVLYWNPDVQKDKDGKFMFDFYSSDVEGEYAIVVRAISDKGAVETSQTFIQVK